MQSHWKKGTLHVSNRNFSMNLGFFLSLFIFFLLKWVLKQHFFVQHWIQNQKVLNIRCIYSVLKALSVVGAFFFFTNPKVFKEWETFCVICRCYKRNKICHCSAVSCYTAKKLLPLVVLFLSVTLVHQISIRHGVLHSISTDNLVLDFFRGSTKPIFSVAFLSRPCQTSS